MVSLLYSYGIKYNTNDDSDNWLLNLITQNCIVLKLKFA